MARPTNSFPKIGILRDYALRKICLVNKNDFVFTRKKFITQEIM